MNPLAHQLNTIIENSNPHVYQMLSKMGKELFFPKGILTQSAEAKQKAYKINATIGIAKQNNGVMSLNSVTSSIKDLETEEYLPYASSFGIPALRNEWQKALYRKNPSLTEKNISLPVVTSGITHAVSTFADLWIDPGDTVLLPDMMWGNYNMTFGVRNGAKITHYNTFLPDLSRMDIPAFEASLRQSAKNCSKIVVVLNFPHNPTGYSVSKKEGRQMADILIDIAQKGTNIVAAFDDAYFGLFFEEETLKESIFSLIAGEDKRLVAVKLDGATKEDYVWGLRTGFITYGLKSDGESELSDLYEALERKTAGCIRGCVSNSSHLSQSIILKSMGNAHYEKYKKEKFELLKERASLIKEVLKDPVYNDAWEAYPFNSGYFMCIRLKDTDAEELRVHMLEHYGVGLIALGEKNIRVAFSCLEKEQVRELFDLLIEGIGELRKTQR